MKNLKISICAYGLCKDPVGPRRGFDLVRNVEEACALLKLAAGEGADLAVLPELFALQNCEHWIDRAEPLDGYVISSLCKAARRLGMGIAAGHATRIAGRRHNSMVLIDRQGKIAALYHKMYPTIWELEAGIRPGKGPVAVETEFGRLGFAICYDLNFAELRLAYRDLAPDLILFGSAFRGGLQTRWWAYETRSYLVSSCIDPQSVIVNPIGQVVAATNAWTRTATRTINLDYAVLHYDYTNRHLEEFRRKHGRQLQFDWAESEGVMLVTSLGKASARALIRTMGWSTVEAYFSRSRRLRRRALAGSAIPKGEPAW